jgi:hypothetical protein
MIPRAIPAVLAFWLLCRPALAEDFRGLVVAEVRLRSEAAFEQSVGIALSEMAAVHLDGDTRFLRGLRLELVLSNLLKQHFDSFALAVYRKVNPGPLPGVKAYQGERIFFQYLPYQNRVYVLLPLGGMEGVDEPLPAGSFRVETPLARNDFPLLVAIRPLMKGIPDAVLESKFVLTVRPILEKKGQFELVLRYPEGMEGEPVALFLDEQELTAFEGRREVPTGLHRLRVTSSAFKEVNTGFTVESGKTSVVEIQLELLASLLTIEAPENAEIYLDGEKLAVFAGIRLPIEEGSHQVRIKVADYSVSKKFTVSKGRHYHISCIFDILVSED